MDALQSAVWRSRAFGDFWSHLLVAEGAVDIAAEPVLNLYDVAGVSLVVTEAGGRFTGLDGVDGPDRGSGVSTNGLLHESVLATLAPTPACSDRAAPCAVPRRQQPGCEQQRVQVEPAVPTGGDARRVAHRHPADDRVARLPLPDPHRVPSSSR